MRRRPTDPDDFDTSVDDSEWYLNVLPQTRLLGAGMGGASMEAKGNDGETGEMVAAVMQTQGGGRIPLTGWGTWADAERVMNAWAAHFRERLDEAHADSGE